MLGDFFSDHSADDFLDINSGLTTCPHHPSTTQNCDLINDTLYFVQTMRYIKNGDAAISHTSQQFVQGVDFVLTQRCRWFIQDDHLRVNSNCLCNFDELLFADGELSGYRFGGYVYIHS